MNEDLTEIKKGALSKLGEHLMTGFVAVVLAIVAVLVVWGKKLWAWWIGFRFTAEVVSRVEFWSAVVTGLVVVLAVLLYIKGLLKRNSELENLLKQQHFPPPSELPSKIPRTGTDSVGRYIERPSDMAFHVLKAFDRINPNSGAMTVQMVSHFCQISETDALSCVKELWNMQFVFTRIPGPGEWNGHYAITPAGRKHVALFAT